MESISHLVKVIQLVGHEGRIEFRWVRFHRLCSISKFWLVGLDHPSKLLIPMDAISVLVLTSLINSFAVISTPASALRGLGKTKISFSAS